MPTRNFLKLSLFSLFFLTSCFNNSSHKEIFTYSKQIKKAPFKSREILIASTGSLMGREEAFEYTRLKTIDSFAYKIEVGGFDTLAKYVSVLKEVHPDNLLLVDLGHNLTKVKSKETFNKYHFFYNYFAFDAIKLTLSDLNYFIDNGGVRANFLNSNFVNMQTMSPEIDSIATPYVIKEINGLKILIISLASTKKSKIPQGYYYDDPVLSYLKIKDHLKRQKYNAVIVLSDFKTECSSSIYVLNHAVDCKLSEKKSGQDDPLVKFLKRLPSDEISLVINTYPGVQKEDSIIYGKIAGIPVLQSPGETKFISLAKLHFNKQGDLLADKTSLLRPVRTCNSFFEATNDCFIDSKIQRNKLIRNSEYKLIPATFFGKNIQEMSLENFNLSFDSYYKQTK